MSYHISPTKFVRESSHSRPVNPVTSSRNGRRGRPRKDVDPAFLQEAFNPMRKIKVKEMARRLNLHPQTLKSRLREGGIDYKFSSITDAELDNLVQLYHQQNPNSGIRYVTGYLRCKGFRLQRRRITASLERVDKLGRSLRRRQRTEIRRQAYKVARPHALWHLDGHHKLILWGFVIHGCVDGYSRAVCFTSFTFNLLLTLLGQRSQDFIRAPTTAQLQFFKCFYVQ